jgi:hypothetical protein
MRKEIVDRVLAAIPYYPGHTTKVQIMIDTGLDGNTVSACLLKLEPPRAYLAQDGEMITQVERPG